MRYVIAPKAGADSFADRRAQRAKETEMGLAEATTYEEAARNIERLRVTIS